VFRPFRLTGLMVTNRTRRRPLATFTTWPGSRLPLALFTAGPRVLDELVPAGRALAAALLAAASDHEQETRAAAKFDKAKEPTAKPNPPKGPKGRRVPPLQETAFTHRWPC
jgi:hypothetical protein